MVSVFREVRRILRDDGTCWVNMGDSYSTGTTTPRGATTTTGPHVPASWSNRCQKERLGTPEGYKTKDRLGIPHRLVFALQADGWYWRDEIVWSKPNPMPESVTDRTTKAHEFVFLLSKQPRYFYDGDAVKEPMAEASEARYSYGFGGAKNVALAEANIDGVGRRTSVIGTRTPTPGRNLRSVWPIATTPFPGAHFATMPPELAERCIKAGTSERGCCPACGSPWMREVERTALPLPSCMPDPSKGMTRSDGSSADDAGRKSKMSGQMWAQNQREHPPRYLGWSPSCSCPAADPVPCVVFDPFAGSGTTLMVACQLGRSAVGCDLSADYLGLARERIAEGLRPVSKLDPARARAPLAGQLSLFA